jgi:hypothetical protein
MQIKLSPQTIEALAFVISGGSANDSTPLIGLYRSGPKLERFMRSCNVDLRVGSSSRLPALTECLIQVARGEDAQALLPRIIEAAADPRDFPDAPEQLTKVVDYLNKYLAYDGLELQRLGQSMRLVASGTHTKVITDLAVQADVLDLDTVRRDLDRALGSAENDPEDAVTAACSTVESMCRSILLELGLPLPQRKDISALYKAVREPRPARDGRALPATPATIGRDGPHLGASWARSEFAAWAIAEKPPKLRTLIAAMTAMLRPGAKAA